VTVDLTNLCIKFNCTNICDGGKCCDAQCVVQHSCSRSLPLSFMSASPCWPFTPFHTTASFPTCALKSPVRIVNSLGSTFPRASLVSSTYCVLSLGRVPESQRSNNFKRRHTHPHSEIKSVTQFASCGFTSIASRIWANCWLNVRVVECPLIIQLNSVRTIALSQ